MGKLRDEQAARGAVFGHIDDVPVGAGQGRNSLAVGLSVTNASHADETSVLDSVQRRGHDMVERRGYCFE